MVFVEDGFRIRDYGTTIQKTTLVVIVVVESDSSARPGTMMIVAGRR
jgi:hypothetical protein